MCPGWGVEGLLLVVGHGPEPLFMFVKPHDGLWHRYLDRAIGVWP